MSEWTHVADIYEIPEGKAHTVELKGVEIAIFRVEGSFYAIRDLCTHADVALSGGYVEGCIVHCPRHGGQFDLRTGEAMCPPVFEPVRTFPLRLRDERIELCWEEE